LSELTIKPEEIRAALDSFVASYEPSKDASEEVGRVTLAADGIARVEGLPGVMANELVKFEDGTLGLALNLEEREIGVVILGDFAGIEEGQAVRRTGEVLSVPVGDGYLGRVVNPLGQPIDGNLLRTFAWVVAMNGALMVDSLRTGLPSTGKALGEELTATLLAGWGADPSELRTARELAAAMADATRRSG